MNKFKILHMCGFCQQLQISLYFLVLEKNSSISRNLCLPPGRRVDSALVPGKLAHQCDKHVTVRQDVHGKGVYGNLNSFLLTFL